MTSLLAVAEGHGTDERRVVREGAATTSALASAACARTRGRRAARRHATTRALRHSRRALIVAILATFAARPDVRAQATDAELAILRLEATPIGALPPLSLPMPASRNHNYWGIRLQTGQRNGRGGADLRSIAGGIDLQWRGGSIFGATAGYQARDCDVLVTDCGGHMLFGVRGRFNVMTGGPGVASGFDYSATSILGTEIGIGFAPDVTPGVNACTFDVGVPLALAMFQKVRVVPFLTPSVVWDVGCSQDGPPTTASYLMSVGLGVQQLWLRGLDVYLGFQKIFRSDTGYHFGLSITYVRLP